MIRILTILLMAASLSGLARGQADPVTRGRIAREGDPARRAKMLENGELMGQGVAEGEPAPDFELKLIKAYDLDVKVDGKTPEKIGLSMFKGKKPVVLIFGSYT